MKRELKINDSKKIAITDNGKVTVPSEVRMTITEIADLFGIYHQTTKRHIRAIEKSSVADGDYSMSCVVEGLKIYPEYYGLDMIIAIAFRVQTEKAEMFRRWIERKTITNNIGRAIVVQIGKNQGIN